MSITATLVMAFIVFLPIFVQSPPVASIKKGLANTLHSGAHPEDAIAVGAAWQYFWWNQATIVDGVESVPMIDTPAAMDIPVSGNSRWLMGFNEPEIATQANITPEFAAQLWHMIEISHADKLLVSPAPVRDEEWLSRFRDSYHKRCGEYPRLDAMAVHCYLPGASDCIEWIMRFIDKARAWGIGQVWVTEFAFANPNETEAFVQWMEAEPMIARYAIFVNRMDAGQWGEFALLDNAGRLTGMGRMYAALPR